MKKRLMWLRRECAAGKTCAGVGNHINLPGGKIVQGYVITDPVVLADLGTAPTGEAFLWMPDETLTVA